METMQIKGLNQAAAKIHRAAVDKGFWDKPSETGTLLMLCVSELSEALEADRHNKYAETHLFDIWENQQQEISNDDFKEEFENSVKDTFEDEIADTIIRLLDLCGSRGINIEKHIELKLKYNASRPRLHGKKY